MSATNNPGSSPEDNVIVEYCETMLGSKSLLTQFATVDESTDELAAISEVAEWDAVDDAGPESADVFKAWYTYVVHQLVDAANRDVLEELLETVDVERPGADMPEADRPHTEIADDEVRGVVATLEDLFGPESTIVEKVIEEAGPTGQADITEPFGDAADHFDSSLDPRLGKAGALAEALAVFYTEGYRLHISG